MHNPEARDPKTHDMQYAHPQHDFQEIANMSDCSSEREITSNRFSNVRIVRLHLKRVGPTDNMCPKCMMVVAMAVKRYTVKIERLNAGSSSW